MSRPAFVEVGGRRVRVRVDGDPHKPPVLLIHGIGRSLEDWDPQYEPLAAAHRVIAVDVPGFGFSDRPDGPISLSTFANGVLGAVDVLGETRPLHIVGNSLGGAITLQILATRPERVASMALIDSAGFGSEVTMLLRILAMPVIGPLSTKRTTRPAARMLERACFADPALATEHRVDRAMAIAAKPHHGEVMLATALQLASGRGIKPGWRRQLAAFAALHQRPTLVMWGEKDKVLPAHHIDEARRVFPHAETHLLPGVGHMPQIEAPDEFADLLLPFLAKATANS
ncbi:MAG TPA: alpha/beta fold hydrolase [Mycobacterium sp.]|uniref:alpha/beta fold hydrolase n=1 Tax=Mycolicibacterium sp. TaxID=2320850 RepID=UPI0025F94189|nr:alpha/beta fold hydrolase [Mycolicibacterium sp.]HPX35240.1 alpha/beta fold hydrolase [Mycobacterium sp.]HQC75653.1 alpha/beta fold hydrolase [Mycobacterium sp.]